MRRFVEAVDGEERAALRRLAFDFLEQWAREYFDSGSTLGAVLGRDFPCLAMLVAVDRDLDGERRVMPRTLSRLAIPELGLLPEWEGKGGGCKVCGDGREGAEFGSDGGDYLRLLDVSRGW
jgi:hypothetical protein